MVQQRHIIKLSTHIKALSQLEHDQKRENIRATEKFRFNYLDRKLLPQKSHM